MKYSTTGYEAINCDSLEEFLERYKIFLFKIRPNRGREAKENSVKNLIALEKAKANYKINSKD
jgi:hypothetical protein